jgi:ribosomal-protein-alanine N-acetyltransferase
MSKFTSHILETDRFLITPVSEADYDFLLGLYSDPLVMKYISTGVRDAEKTRESLKRFMNHWDLKGFGMWVVSRKENGEKIGYTGFRTFPDNPDIEFAGLFIRSAWGQGAATEAGKACLNYGFSAYKFDFIYGVVDPENKASLHWLPKLGMKRVPEKDGIFHNTFTHYFSIHAS